MSGGNSEICRKLAVEFEMKQKRQHQGFCALVWKNIRKMEKLW